MEKLRLGGMALQNGVLVHGPTAWAAAVRDDEGVIRVATGRKRRLASKVQTPFVRGPLRLAEAFALLPDVRRALPQARFAFERPAIAVWMVASSLVASVARRSRLPVLPREAVAAVASLVPAVMALRGGELASYHGAEHVSIGAYESGEPAAKEHERCGSHLVGPMLVTSAAASAIAQKVPAAHRRTAQVAETPRLRAVGRRLPQLPAPAARRAPRQTHPVARERRLVVALLGSGHYRRGLLPFPVQRHAPELDLFVPVLVGDQPPVAGG